MSDDAPRAAAETGSQEREAELAFARIKERHERRIQGNFDLDHLKAVHASIFQDLPERQPGIVRRDFEAWTKLRELEGRGHLTWSATSMQG